MKISVNVPTCNESKIIKKFINNVKQIADEIILIDNSSDNTVKIAKRLSSKVKIINYPVKHFAKIRNKGINAVKKGWYVLFMDADELLSKQLINELKELKKSDGLDAYLIRRRNYFKYKHGTACLTTRFIKGEPKLFKKGTVKFINVSHEKAVYTKKNLKIKELQGPTLHYPEVGKYKVGGKYMTMYVKGTIKRGSFKKELKQLIKYILIFNYHPRYWIGNLIFFYQSIKHTISFIKQYYKLKSGVK